MILAPTLKSAGLIDAHVLQLDLEAAIAEVHPLITGLVFLWRR